LALEYRIKRGPGNQEVLELIGTCQLLYADDVSSMGGNINMTRRKHRNFIIR